MNNYKISTITLTGMPEYLSRYTDSTAVFTPTKGNEYEFFGVYSHCIAMEVVTDLRNNSVEAICIAVSEIL